MKKRILSMILVAAMLSLLVGCAGGEKDEGSKGDGEMGKICFIITGGTLGDQAINDAMFSGMETFADKNGVQFDAVELAEVSDIDATVRSMAADGYTLFAFNSADGADLMDTLCIDLPDVTFAMYNGTNMGGYPNLVNITTDVAGAGFLCAVLGCLMNEHLGGERAVGYIGSIRNPNLERVRYAMQAAADVIGGRLDAAYVGSFTDAATAKEIAQQMQSGGIHVIQAWAGGGNMGIYEAAETAGDGFYSMGGANGQYHLSDTIVAALNTQADLIMEDICNKYMNGTLEAGIYDASVKNGMVDCIYAPDERADLIPDDITAVVEEYRQKIVDGELIPPTTEEEYTAFAEAHIS